MGLRAGRRGKVSDLEGRSKGRTGNGSPGREQQQWAASRLGRRRGRRRQGERQVRKSAPGGKASSQVRSRTRGGSRGGDAMRWGMDGSLGASGRSFGN